MQFTTKMKALRILENEHMLIRHMMHEWFDTLRKAKETNKEMALMIYLKDLKETLPEFLDVLSKHQLKEERFFFPILGSYIGTEQGPIVSIEAEHEEMMKYFAHFMHSNPQTSEEIKQLLYDLNEGYEILMVHMYKEESVLFTMAEKVFKIKDEDTLLEAVNTKIL